MPGNITQLGIPLPVPVSDGGTGDSSVTAYAPICGGTTTTAPLQSATTGISTVGYVLTSTGAGSLPTFQASAAVITITGDSGGAQTSNTFTFTGGTTGLTFTGLTDTFTLGGTLVVADGGTGATTLSGVLIGHGTSPVTGNPVNQYDVLVGGASNAIVSVSPSATSGVPLISQGSATNPIFGTAVVAGGGTGLTSTSPYAPIVGGTTGTAPLQSAGTGQSNVGWVLTSTGSSSLPTFQAPGLTSISITGDTGGALIGDAFTFTGGTTGLLFEGSGTTETLAGTLVVANGGTGATTLTGVLIGNGTSPVTANPITQHDVLVGGASNAITSVAPSGASGIPFISNGPTVDPSFGTAVVAGGGTGIITTTPYAPIVAGTTSTGPFQQATTGFGSAGYVLTSNGSSSLPSWQVVGTSNITITGDTGGPMSGNMFDFTGGTTGLTFAGAANTFTLGGTLVVAAGGTGADTLTGVLIGHGTSAVTGNPVSQFEVLVGGSSNGIVSIAPTATSGVPLISQGSGTNPAFGTVVVAGGGTGATTLTGVLIGNGTSPVTGNPITQYDVLIGGTGNAISSIAPSPTAGVPLISDGSLANPSFGTALVVGGGTGLTATTPYAPIVGGTTTTGALQQATTGFSNSGWVLTSTGASSLPIFQAPATVQISITGDSGGAQTSNAFTFTGGTSGLTFTGATDVFTLGGDLGVSHGGTGATTLTGVLIGNGTSPITGNPITQFDLLVGGASNAINSITPSVGTGIPLISEGTGANPTFGTAVVAGGGTGATTLTGVLIGNGTSPITGNAVTQYDVLIGGASNAIVSVAPSATSGIPLISEGSSSNPAFGTAVVAGGGTGATTLTGVLIGNGTSPITGNAVTQYDVLVGGASNAITSIAPSATSGIPLISDGSAANPMFGTAVVAGGGTGATSLTGVLIGNGTSPVTGNAVTQHDVLIGGASNAITSVAPSVTAGVPLISNGAGIDPSFGTVTVPGGGTGIVTTTPYAPVIGGTTSTGPFQQATSGFGNSGWVLTSTGSGSAPTFQALTAAVITLTGDSGGGLSGSSFTITGDTTGLTFAGAGTTLTLGGTINAAHGGTGLATYTPYAPICAGTTATGPFQQATTNFGNSGYVLTSTGSSSLPTFQALSAAVITITGDSGGALSGSNFTFTGGTTGLTFAGSGTTETLGGKLVVANGGTGAATLTGVLIGNGTSAVTGNPITQYDVLVGGASNAITSVAPSATSGVPLISGGSSANPTFGTAVVAGGGTGIVTTTAYAPICGGTTATGAFQAATTGFATSGYVLTSNGSSALPSWQATGSTITITGDSGGGLVSSSFTFTGGTTGLTFSGAVHTETLTGTLVVANGGTGATTLTGVLIGNGTSAVTASAITQYDVLVGGASNAITSVAPSATAGIPLVSGGSSANPSFTTAVVAGGGTGITTTTAYAPIVGGTTATGAFQAASTGLSTAGYVLTSNGSSAVPSFQPSGVSLLGYTAVSSGPYTVLSTDHYLGVTVSTVGISILLPNGPSTGRTYTIKDTAGLAATHNITVTTVGGSVTIDGSTSFVMNTAYEAINVIFNGANYEVW